MLFIFTKFLTGGTGLLYNTSTQETITPDQIAGGGHSSNSINEKNTQPGINAFIKLDASF
jgi:hypothetical protein